MANVISIGLPENSGEQLVLEYLRMYLPNSYIVLWQVVVPNPSNNKTEIDAVVIGQYGVFAMEIKNWKGKLSGRMTGSWSVEGKSVPNPCAAVLLKANSLRSIIRDNAKEVFMDPRVFNAIDVYALLALVDPGTDTSDVQVEPSKNFLFCKTLEEIVPRLLMEKGTKRFLTTREIQKIAELLGATKDSLADWIETRERAILPQATPFAVCPRCGFINRRTAKFCSSCATALDFH